ALAVHGHAYILHFVLEIDEIPVIIDTGTYQYHNNFADWRSYFRGSHAHNTIAPAGLDQLKSTGPMMWHTKPKVDLLNIQNDSSKVSCEASHNGFQNQKRNIKHTRRIEYYKGSKVYEVIDKLDGQGTEPLYFYLHLDKGIEKFQHEKEKVVLQLQNGKKVTLENKEFGNLQMFKGNDELPLGWQSTRYDHKEPAITLRLPINLSGSFEMKTIIDFNN
ncbi:MAG: heparinase II/III-family protein, partial [Bacteroidetes bacterium]|nr:heparinase II/III-family protein [Bacteroidota bacterium]